MHVHKFYTHLTIYKLEECYRPTGQTRHYYSNRLHKDFMTFFTEICGHDGTNNYMNHNLDMKGKSVFNANPLLSLTYVYTPTLRATNIELSDVSTSGAIDLIMKSGSTNFMAFSVTNGINIYRPLLGE